MSPPTEFVIAGFTEPTGSRKGLGALLLGVHDGDGRLVYSGRVGTGFTGAALEDLESRLHRIEAEKSPFAKPPSGAGARGVHWVKPRLVAEVQFSEWTNDGLLRQPSFQGIRDDKDPQEVVREREVAGSAQSITRSPRRGAPLGEIAGVPLTHPERILFPEQGISKKALAIYYESISAHVVPHVTARPLTLLRCPRGQGGQCFYQKHAGTGALPAGIHRVMIEEKKGRGSYLTIDSVEGLIGLVQMGVLEIHTWNARTDRLERPDRMIFDLDPGPSVPWEKTIEAARLVKDRLAGVDLESFLKTTGGKGLHVVVPLGARNEWQVVRELSRALAESIAREDPRRYTTDMSKAKRKGKIFIDYLRNVRGATAVAAYSTRARPMAPVSTPLRWDELKPSVRSDGFTILDVPRRLSKMRSDPWKGYDSARAVITPAMLRKLLS